MMRSLKNLFSFNTIAHIKYLPIIIIKIKNWVPFLLGYVGLSGNGLKIYHFRNGLKLKTLQAVDTATIAVTWIKKDYGKIYNNSTIVDIGANIGTFALYAASTAKNVTVYAYEPMSANFNLLKENIMLNNQESSVKYFRLGVAGKNGKKRLYLGDSPYHSMYLKNNNQPYEEIECTTFNKIFENNGFKTVDILKIDCEGAEFEILYKSSPDYLVRISEIRMEYHNLDDSGNNITALSDYLKNHGFEIIFYRENSDKNTGNIWFKHKL